MRLLPSLFQKFIRHGHLRLIDAQGRHYEIGEGERPALTIRLHDRATERALILNPQLAFGEAYMDGRLTVEGGDIAQALDLITSNLGHGFGGGPLEWMHPER